jgi:hypothetical protein
MLIIQAITGYYMWWKKLGTKGAARQEDANALTGKQA